MDDKAANKSVTYAYDFVGNITSVKTYLYTTGALGSPLTTQSYAYNHNGIRTSKTVNGTTTYYEVDENNNVVKQYELVNDAETNVIEFVYDSSNSPIYFTYNNATYYYEKNLQGDIVAILDGSGNTVVEYTYDIWGKLVSITGTLADTVGAINPLRYRGYYYDTETQLYYLQSRYYSPELMRFISQDDPVFSNSQGEPLGSNLYAYCLNNPVMNSDPSGFGKTYVFYYNNPSNEFKTQAMNSPYYNNKSKNIIMIAVITIRDFINAWKNMTGDIDSIYLYLHGGKGVLYFKGQTMNISQIKSLKSKRVKYGLYLLSCHGGEGKEGNNVAWALAKLTGTMVFACKGGVSYTKIFSKYFARSDGKINNKYSFSAVWGKYYYQKRYIWWGNVIAKYSFGSF